MLRLYFFGMVAISIAACSFNASLGTSTTARPPPSNPQPAGAGVLAAGAATPAVASPGAPGPSGPADGNYLGCYIDADHRDLADALESDGGMSVQVCAEQCRSRNKPYFGMQDGVWCTCGTSYGRYGQAPAAECGVACAGNPSQKCGGPWRNSVYRMAGAAAVPLAPPPKGKYLGCFIDADHRDLADLLVSDGAMNQQVCAQQCRAINKPYFGLQDGVWCTCGSSYGRYGQAPPAECGVACAGTPSAKCGGPWRNSVYQIAL